MKTGDLSVRPKPLAPPLATASRFGVKSIGGQVNLLIAFAIVCQVCVIGHQLFEYRNVIWAERQHESTDS